MNNVIALEDYLPIYSSNGILLSGGKSTKRNTIHLTEIDDGISEWVKKAAQKGRIGELMVKNFIEQEYKKVVVEMPDSAGYDFLVKDNDKEYCIEVKTSENKHFYISQNEISVSRERGNSYFILFVEAEGNGKNTICKHLFVIENPYESLNMRWVFNVEVPSSIVNMQVQSIKVEIEDLYKFKEDKKFLKYVY